MTQLLENRQIEHELADGDTNPRRTLRRLENSERKILNRKMRVGRDVDKVSGRGLAIFVKSKG